MANTIKDAVEPMRQQAMERAETIAREHVAGIVAAMERAGWDINAVAPYPKTTGSNAITDRFQYRQAVEWYNHAHALLTFDDSRHSTGIPGHPSYFRRSSTKEERYIETARQAASASFDAYVKKLE